MRAIPFWKRTFDVVASTSALIALSPVVLVVAAANRALMGPGVLFRQSRGGHGGMRFDILKFRTMTDARDDTGALLDDHERRHGFGDALRATSLDELPTLFNIVRGDMSIVGPRPLMAKYLDRYSPEQARRHDVRPGLTGLAQVSGRNALTWEEKFAFDLEYVDRLSPTLDAAILWATVRTVFSTSGADGIDHTTEFMGVRANPSFEGCASGTTRGGSPATTTGVQR